MLFYFDESGDFVVPDDDSHRCGVVCGVVIPKTIAGSLQEEYLTFVASLASAEKKDNEPKGYLMTDESRQRFCKLLQRWPQVLVTPTTLDLSIKRSRYPNGIGIHMKDRLYEDAKICVYDTMREQTEELGRQWANLSEIQGLRLIALTSCFWEAIQHTVIFHSDTEYHSCWDSLSFVVDAVQTQPLSREEKVFQIMALMWLCAWSKHRPLITIDEIHTDDHPFIQKYGTDKGFDLGKILYGNITFSSSKESWGLQIADICANIVYQAVHDLNNYRNRLPIFRQLMRNCPYGPKRGGPGLVALGTQRKPAPKYSLLYRVMNARHD